MAEVTNRKVNIYIETGAAQKEFDKLNAKAEALQKQLASTSDKGQLKKLQKELDALKNPLDVATKKLNGGMQPSMKELTKLVNDLGNRMKRMSTSDADFSGVLQQYSQAKSQLQQVQAEVKKVEQAHDSAKKGGGFMQSFFGNLAANAVSQVTGMVTQAIGQALQWALEIEGVRRAYNRLNQPGLLDNLRQATNGTVTDLELMKRAVAAKNFQIPLETLGTLMEFAKRRANETGQSVDYLVDSIVTGIGRKSPLILDNLGISASRLSEEFKKTGDFAKATATIVNEELNKMGTAVETNQDKVDQWKTRWSNAWTSIGEGAISAGNMILDAFRAQYDMTGLMVDKANQEIAQQNESAWQHELQMIEFYQGKFASADDKGRKKIIEQVEGEIRTTTMLRDNANRDGLQAQATQFQRYLDQWGKFLGDLKNQNIGTNNLAGIDQEMKLLNDQLQQAEIGSKKFLDIQKQIKDLEKKRSNALGTDADKAEKKGESDAAKKRKQDAEAITRDQQRLNEQLRQIRMELTMFDMSEKDKELTRAAEKYEQLRKLAHGNKDQLKQLEKSFFDETLQIMVKYGRKELEEFVKTEQAKKDAAEQKHREMMDSAQRRLVQFGEMMAKGQDVNNRNRTANIELQLLQANGKKRLELNKQLLQEQMRQELQNTELTQAQAELIVEQYKQKELDMERQHWTNVASIMLEFVGQALGVLEQFGQAKTAKENAEVERDRQVNDRKKGNLDRMLKNKQISQQEHDRKVEEMDRAQEKKENIARQRQFRRDQRMSVAKALIGGAQAATTTLAEWGMPAAIPWLSLVAASTIAQVATISAQKAPEFGWGGLLNGPSHQSKSKGMPVINPVTNQVQAYMEGGEAITNKRTMADRSTYSVSGTPSQIISTLNGLHGGVQWSSGAVLKPLWSTNKPSRMNIDGINNSYKTVKMFAGGGVFDPGGTIAPPVVNMDAIGDLVVVMHNLQTTLENGIPAFMSLSHFETQAKRKQAIVDSATLK